MDKRLMLALGVTSIWGSAESVYALAEQDRLIEERQHVRIKPLLSTKQTNRANNSKLKLSINVKGGKNTSSLQPPKNKKLSKKQIRDARKKFSLALKASKKKKLSALIQTKKKARLSVKRNRKTILKIRKIERKRVQFRKKWERQEARLQAKKGRLLRRNPAALNRQKLQEQIVLNRLKNPTILRNPIVNSKKVESVRNLRSRTPALPLSLKDPRVAKKIVSPVRKATPPVRRVHSIMNSKKVESVRNIRLRTPILPLGLKAPETAKKIVSPVRKATSPVRRVHPIMNSKKVENVRNIRLRTPILPLGLKALEVTKKIVLPVRKVTSPPFVQKLLKAKSLPLAHLEGNPRKQANSSLLKTVAVKRIEGKQSNSSLLRPVAVRRNEEGQVRLRTANDSSEQSAVRIPVAARGNQEEQARLRTANDSSEQSTVIIPVAVRGNQEEQARLRTDNDSSEQSAVIIPVAVRGNQEEQASLRTDNDSSEQSAVIPVAVRGNQEEQASLRTGNDSSEQSAVIIPVAVRGNQEEQASLRTDNDSSEQSAVIIPVAANRDSLASDNLALAALSADSLPPLHSGALRSLGMDDVDVEDDTELEKSNHSPKQPVSKGLTLEELELNSENLTPILRELTGKIWNFVENTSKEVSATSFRSLEALKEITNFTGAVNDMLQHINPSARHENGLALDGGYDLDEGGYALEDFNEGEPSALYSQPQNGQAATQEEKNPKNNGVDEEDDLKDKTFVPVVAEKSDFDMEVYAVKFESLEKAISQFQSKAFNLRGIVEMNGSDDIEGKKADLRKQLTEAYTIETTLSSLKLYGSEPSAESFNSILKSYEESVGSEKVRLSMALKNLLELEAKNNATSSLSHSTPIDDEKEKKVGLSDTSSMTPLSVTQDDLQTGATLKKKDIDSEDQSPLISKPVTTDSDELSTRPFPTILGSLNELLDRLVDRVGLNSDVASGHRDHVIKMYSSWLKEKLVSIETGEEHKSSSSIVSTQEEPYDFAADMKDLRSKISHYLTLSSPNTDEWLRNFRINGARTSAVQLIKELTELNQKLEEEGQTTSAQQESPVAVMIHPSRLSPWSYVPSNLSSKPGETETTKTSSQQDQKKDDNDKDK